MAFSLGLATTLAVLGVGASLAGKAYGQIGQGIPIAVSVVAMIMGLNLLEVGFVACRSKPSLHLLVSFATYSGSLQLLFRNVSLEATTDCRSTICWRPIENFSRAFLTIADVTFGRSLSFNFRPFSETLTHGKLQPLFLQVRCCFSLNQFKFNTEILMTWMTYYATARGCFVYLAMVLWKDKFR